MGVGASRARARGVRACGQGCATHTHTAGGSASDCLARHTGYVGHVFLTLHTYITANKTLYCLEARRPSFPHGEEVLTTTLDSLPRRQGMCSQAPPAGRLPRLHQSRSPPARPPAADTGAGLLQRHSLPASERQHPHAAQVSAHTNLSTVA